MTFPILSGSCGSEGEMRAISLCRAASLGHDGAPRGTANAGRGHQAVPSTGLVLQDGTPIKLRLGRTVTSADAHVGDSVDFDVLEEIRLGDILVIPKGSVAWATITEAEHAE
jgi:hypothetical protein